MKFDVNAGILYAIVAVIILLVLVQSVFFLVKAWKRARALGMDTGRLRRIAITAAMFTIAPAIAIVISVMTLSKDLGIPLPWMRLSVVGSMSYETIAAANAMNAMGLSFGQSASLNASQYVTILSVMTLSIMAGILLVPLVCKRLQGGMSKLERRDGKWADVFSNAMFIGMIAAFTGFVFCDVADVFSGSTAGLIPVCVMAVSGVVMCVAGLLMKLFKKAWISDYALPISLIAGMASAIPFTAWLG